MIKRAKKYTHQSAYKEYLEALQDRSSALTYKQWDAAIRAFMKRLSREIIVGPYEWKLPSSGGYLRVAKDRRGMFFWYWDKINDYCRIPKKRLWSFRAVVDWQTKQIGSRGLIQHYLKCKNDNKMEDYEVPDISHRHTVFI